MSCTIVSRLEKLGVLFTMGASARLKDWGLGELLALNPARYDDRLETSLSMLCAFGFRCHIAWHSDCD